MKKSHHYIPQVYLKAFVDPSSKNTSKMKPYLYVFTSSTSSPRKRSPSNVACRNMYYSLGDDSMPEKDRLLIEDFLSILESKYRRIFNKIIEDTYSTTLSDEERAYLLFFVAAMKLRVPDFKDSISKFLSDTFKIVTDITSSTKDRFNDVIDGLEKETGKKLVPTEMDREELREFMRSDKYELTPSEYFLNQSIMLILEDLYRIIDMRYWEILEAPQNVYFVTSDNPVVLHEPYRKPSIYGIGFGHKKADLYFPISPTLCLHAHFRRTRNHNDRYQHRVIKSAKVRQINNEVSKYITDYVFTSTPDLSKCF